VNLNFNQGLAILIAVLGVVGGSTAQLTDLFGAGTAHLVVSAASFGSSIVSAVLVATSGQASMVKAVNDMPGVDKIVVNSQANQTLAQIAVDPASKVQPSEQAKAAVQKTAQGG